jgi:hypothetical protein
MVQRTAILGPGPRWAACVGLATLGLVLALAWPRPTSTVGGEIRELPPRETFLSGGARSEVVLREMSETLRRIDLRLERFERALRDAEQRPAEQEPAPQGAAPEPNPQSSLPNP